MILTTACDQMRRAADALMGSHNSRVFLFNIPATWQSTAARRVYHSELERLGGFLVSLGGHSPSEDELLGAMDRFEARRDRVRAVLQRDSFKKGAEALARYFADTEFEDACAPPAVRSGVPLALVGGPLLPAQWSLFETIERAGGRVVLNAAEPGERCLPPPLPSGGPRPSPFVALADHYFSSIVDVFSRPNSRLYDWLAVRLLDTGARGIVLWTQIGCDLWRAETATLREEFGMPVLVVEAQGFKGGNARDLNRLAAFVESLL
jgi:benzoyl-CoA reductase/2-hydroxyglutaryl-CoA dehydratase subunit BcrC/BadD/HgdB